LPVAGSTQRQSSVNSGWNACAYTRTGRTRRCLAGLWLSKRMKRTDSCLWYCVYRASFVENGSLCLRWPQWA
jgi:hypothetical protein